MNYIGIIFSFGGIGAVIGGMTVALIMEIRERRHVKKRSKRCHGIISTWQDLYVGDR